MVMTRVHSMLRRLTKESMLFVPQAHYAPLAFDGHDTGASFPLPPYRRVYDVYSLKPIMPR